MKTKHIPVYLLAIAAMMLLPFKIAAQDNAIEGTGPWVPLVYRLSPPAVDYATNLYSDGFGISISGGLNINGMTMMNNQLTIGNVGGEGETSIFVNDVNTYFDFISMI